jgi:hypothetical protein
MPGRSARRRRPPSTSASAAAVTCGAGIRLHRRRSLTAADVTRLDGLPITSPARTVLDLAAAGLRGVRLEAVIDRAVHELLDFPDLEQLLASRQPGTAALRESLARYAPGSVDVRSRLEELCLELCEAHGLPRPATRTAGTDRRGA